MTTRFVRGMVCVLAGALALPVARPLARQSAPKPASGAVAAERLLVDRYCVSCHNGQRKIAGLELDQPAIDDIATHTELWEKVVRKVRTGAMPPQGSPRPDAVALSEFAAAVESGIDRVAVNHPNVGRIPIHRLNRTEYSNAIRDLLGIDVDTTSLLPADDTGFGFDNIADVLSVSPMLMERYLSAALKISRIAVGDVTLRPTTDIFAVNKYLRQDDRVDNNLPFGSRAGLAVQYYFPVDADYVVKLFFTRTYDGRFRGTGEAHQLEVRLNGETIKTLTVGGPAAPNPAEASVRPSQRQGPRALEADGLEVRFTAKAGPGTLAVSFVRKTAEPEGMVRPPYSVTSYEYAGDASVPPGIANLELRGPYDVTGPGRSPSRDRIFTCTESAPNCGRQIVAALARRAYRRPVNDEDIRPLLALVDTGKKSGGFSNGIQMALERILVSPDFLFRVERDPATAAPNSAYSISDVELASRLSFFLWSSIPDEELLALAEKGQLRKGRTLQSQVTRMLADPKADALVANFGGQWLYLRNLKLVAPDPYAFPDFDENLRQAFITELELFLRSQIRNGAPLVDLLTANYTYLNERLAKHYGIPNVYGSHFRYVALTDDNRRGLLGKGGILTLTSYANRTAPTLRGKWLMENILGTPPPPPPPNVPSLKETGADIKSLSMRERMEQHRTNPTCASCHKLMDPIGFALENFDAVGKFRTVSEAGKPIDASAQLADGTKIDGPIALRDALVAHQHEFNTTVVERLLTYAVGRGAESFDQPAVRQILRDAAEHQADQPTKYSWTRVINAIVLSAPFQMRMSASTDTRQRVTP